MKSLLSLCSICGLTLAAILGANLISRHNQLAAKPSEARQVFQVRGKILSLESDGKTVHIAHEEIPGFMPAMTMPFEVRDPKVLAGVSTNDEVKFELVVTKDESWVTRLDKLSEAANSARPANRLEVGEGTSAATLSLSTGQVVPDFTLVDQDGKTFRLRDFRGKAVVLTFIYTRCPLPNYCPLMTKNFAELHERFAKEFPGQVQLMSISFDQEFDHPAVLKRYAETVAPNTSGWTFATGTAEQINDVTELFGLYREPANGSFTHDLRTALISPDGHLVHVWRSNVWTPYEVQRRVGETIRGHALALGK